MSGYAALSSFYDRLMGDVDYTARAGYLLSLMERHRPDKPPALVLDLACGSASLSLELIARGVEVIGVDGSGEMLAVAADKARQARVGESSLLLRCQDMRELDLYGTVDTAVCALDSFNHLCRTADLAEVLRRLRLFIEPDGLLLFDVNTPYKHRQALADNVFVFEQEDFVCVWRNRLIDRTAEVDMQLDFFVQNGETTYERFTDFVRERAYAESTWRRLLADAGFDTLAVYDDGTVQPPRPDSERLTLVARRLPDESP